jgi:peptide chain release factor 2
LRIRELDKESLRDGFWDEPERASGILRGKSRLTEAVEKWKQQKNSLEDLRILSEIASEEQDDQTQEEIRCELERLNAAVRADELKMMLGSEQDPMNAILSIHAGAGGTEAQDWAEMLLRMYLRWAERKGLEATIIDYLPGEEAGIKSVTWTLRGEYAYGYAKAEIGIHRLVRISPFDAGARRHTSFASVFVYPEVDAYRHLPLHRRRRSAREQDRFRGEAHPSADGNCRPVPERAFAAQEQGDGHEIPPFPSL